MKSGTAPYRNCTSIRNQQGISTNERGYVELTLFVGVLPLVTDRARADRLMYGWTPLRILAARGLQPGGPQLSELVHPPRTHGRQNMEESERHEQPDLRFSSICLFCRVTVVDCARHTALDMFQGIFCRQQERGCAKYKGNMWLPYVCIAQLSFAEPAWYY